VSSRAPTSSWWLTIPASTFAQMQTLRKQMKQAGAAVKVAKNRLAKLALEGTDAAVVVPLLRGRPLIAYPAIR